MQTVQTFTATIYVGFRERYTGEVRGIEMAEEALQKCVDRVGLCVTLTPTRFIYSNGHEPGCAIGLINYPRFPSDPEKIRATALEIAAEMLALFHQGKVSVVFPDETVMLSSEEQQ